MLGTIVTACSESESEPEPKPVLCECAEKEHWDECDCGADEGKCDCTVIEYKTLTNGIRVYRDTGVTGAQMDAAVVNVQNGWDGLGAGDAALMKDKVERIIVVSGMNGLEAADAKWVVKLGVTQDAATVTTALKGYLDTQIDPLCVCVEKNHLGIGETCDCNGLRDCECGLQVYGTLGDGTPIYRNGDVNDEQMAMAVANAQSAYNGLVARDIENLVGKIDEIHIMDYQNYFYRSVNGNLVLGIKHDRTISSMQDRFGIIADGLEPTISMSTK